MQTENPDWIDLISYFLWENIFREMWYYSHAYVVTWLWSKCGSCGSQEVAKNLTFILYQMWLKCGFCIASDKSLNHINMADAP